MGLLRTLNSLFAPQPLDMGSYTVSSMGEEKWTWAPKPSYGPTSYRIRDRLLNAGSSGRPKIAEALSATSGTPARAKAVLDLALDYCEQSSSWKIIEAGCNR